MFERLGSLTYRYRFLIVLAWVAGAAWAVLFAPSLAAEGMTDQTSFLPSYASSMQAHDTLERTFPGSTSASSATLSFSRDSGLAGADRAYIAETAAWITSADAPAGLREAVSSVDTVDSRPELASMMRSADGVLELVTVNLNVTLAGGEGDVVTTSLRDHMASTAPAGLAAHVTGAAGISSDYLAAIMAGTDSTTMVTILLVVVILLLIYRAPLAAMVPLVTIGAAFVMARGVLGVLALAGWKVSSLLDTFIVVLVFGVGTDYAIFLISRFREEVAGTDWHQASRTTVRRIGAVISASAATVIVGLGAMAFGDFGMIQTTGPALAVGIFVTLVAGLTLAPALLSIFGHYLFWPLHARIEPEGEPDGFFARLAGAVSRRPLPVTILLLVVLLVPVAALPQMRTNFDVLTELPADSDARAGFDQVATHLGRGKVFQSAGVIDGGANANLLAPASLARLRDTMRDLATTPGVATATSLVTPDGDGTVPAAFQPSAQLGEMARGFEGDSDGAGSGSAGTSGMSSAPADSKALLDPKVTEGLTTAADYLAGLGAAFPDVAGGSAFRAASAGLAKANDQVEQVREAAVVSTQLRSLATALTSPAAIAAGASGSSGSGDSVGVIGDYLAELSAAYPETATLPAFDKATSAAARLEEEASIAAALDLSAALQELATHFDALPDATLFPASLAGTAEAKARAKEITATFDALPADLDALAAVFATRADDIFVPTGLGGDAGAQVDKAVAAFVSADQSAARFYLTTSDDPYSESAFATVRHAQEVLAEAAPGFGTGATALLGGTTAQFADVQDVLGSDFVRVGIITVIGILVVLMILLRAVVAPLYLVGTVLLSCATALGLSSWIFQSVLGQPGVSFYLPILVFVLLVALGSDYNIFLMSRVREESESRPIHDGIRIASGRTGAVITSAGLILAGTFGSMATAPLVVLFQVGVAVALGVLIDTFLVRSILVPAITTLVGDRAWWPSGSGLVAALRRAVVVIPVPEPGLVGGATAVGAGAAVSNAASRSTARRRLAVALGMVALVPVLVGGLLAWSFAGSGEHLAAVRAAVVNEDDGATITSADGTAQRLDLGADLTERLTTGTDPAAFTWVAADATAAADGLSSGRYGAVLTIPSDFSAGVAAARNTADGTTGSVAKATLHLATNDASSPAIASAARSLARAIVASTTEQVTASYVDDVLLRITDAHAEVAAAADRAKQLAAGSSDLVDGAATVSATADELVAGLGQLADGTAAASTGATALVAGVDRLASGTGQLATGASSLGTGAHAAARGANELADGASSLADGLGTLSSGTAALPGNAAALAKGARDVADGAGATAAGSRTLADSLAAVAAGTAGLPDQAKQLDDGAAAVASGAASLATGTHQAATAAGTLAAGAQGLATSVSDYADAVASLAASCAGIGGTDPLCAQLAALAATNDALTSGASSLADGAGALATSSAALAAGADQVADGADDLHAGTGELAAAAPALASGIAQAAAGADALASGASDLAAGAESLADGAVALAGSVPSLTSAVADAAAGARALESGASGVASGVTKLASGADRLASGAGTAASGAAKLADGTSAAATGATQLATGMTDAVDGARLVAIGADGLAGDGRALATDASDLGGTLSDGAAAIPAYSDAARASLGAMAANPIAVETTGGVAGATAGDSLAPTFLALALWLGAMAIYLVLPALVGRRPRPRGWRPVVAGFGVGALIGTVQAALTVLVLRYLVGVTIAELPALVLVAVLAALTFVAVNQALVALFGRRGWLVSLVLAALQVAALGVLYPIETAPAFFGAIHPFLPMTYAVEAFRTLTIGAGPSPWPDAAVLALWLVGAMAVTVAMALRVRRPDEDRTGVEVVPAPGA